MANVKVTLKDGSVKEVAAGSPVALFNSLTNCQPLNASKKVDVIPVFRTIL